MQLKGLQLVLGEGPVGPGLPKQIPPSWQGDRIPDRQIPQKGEPWPGWPQRGDQKDPHDPGVPDLLQNLR